MPQAHLKQAEWNMARDGLRDGPMIWEAITLIKSMEQERKAMIRRVRIFLIRNSLIVGKLLSIQIREQVLQTFGRPINHRFQNGLFGILFGNTINLKI